MAKNEKIIERALKRKYSEDNCKPKKAIIVDKHRTYTDVIVKTKDNDLYFIECKDYTGRMRGLGLAFGQIVSFRFAFENQTKEDQINYLKHYFNDEVPKHFNIEYYLAFGKDAYNNHLETIIKFKNKFFKDYGIYFLNKNNE
ncbi:MAG: hypothetical protein KKF44_03655, partial [Nanoarchaeota archaeon]|nr:hypothetical protein [Nanoarchaeota archaeon]